jgi:hypothetical protein
VAPTRPAQTNKSTGYIRSIKRVTHCVVVPAPRQAHRGCAAPSAPPSNVSKPIISAKPQATLRDTTKQRPICKKRKAEAGPQSESEQSSSKSAQKAESDYLSKKLSAKIPRDTTSGRFRYPLPVGPPLLRLATLPLTLSPSRPPALSSSHTLSLPSLHPFFPPSILNLSVRFRHAEGVKYSQVRALTCASG